MNTHTRNVSKPSRSQRLRRASRQHKLPQCQSTGLARYRDRHQARQYAEEMLAGHHTFEISTFACPQCHGYHLEKTYARPPITLGDPTEPSAAFIESLPTRKRRYVLFDVENLTYGAKATLEEVAALWNILKRDAPGIAPHDHVVVGAARPVVRRYRAAVHGPNVKWVVGADAPDGADHALLSAIDLHRVSREFDELVIMSGDHGFAELARRARLHGLTVQVVTVEHPQQRSMLSRELAAAANTCSLVRLRSRTPGHAHDLRPAA